MRESLAAGAEPRRIPWEHYGCEAILLGAFMVSASVFGVLLFHPTSAAAQSFPSAFARRCLMGAAMGLTAVVLIYSPLGRRSGAHMNPATTATFWSLGRVCGWDAVGYVVAQFAGAVGGMVLAMSIFGERLAHSDVYFVATIPSGRSLLDLGVAWACEFAIAGVLMLVVLWSGNTRRSAPFTGLIAGAFVMLWIVIEAPISGMSMNPARSFGSALVAGLGGAAGTSLWIYFTAPPLGMLVAAWVYTRVGSARRVHCAKIFHDARSPCIFRCEFAAMTAESPASPLRETRPALLASKA
jgi:aquaporin Z